MTLPELRDFLRGMSAAVEEVIRSQALVKGAEEKVQAAKVEEQSIRDRITERQTKLRDEEARLKKFKEQTEESNKAMIANAEETVSEVLKDARAERKKVEEETDLKRAELNRLNEQIEKASGDLAATRERLKRARDSAAAILREGSVVS